MYCKNCGAKIEGNVAYCPTCGVSQGNTQQQPPVINVNYPTGHGYVRKNKWVAFLLCLFLGYLGIHRFYVGKIGTGILWLLTGGLCGVGWIIDCIVIVCGGFRDKASQPLAS